MARRTKPSVKRAKVSQRKPQPVVVNKQVQAQAPAPPVPTLPVGVYFNRSSGYTAILYRVGGQHVHVISMGSPIACHIMSAGAFSRQFNARWPQYPVRRAARLYLDSDMQKEPDALRVLRLLVAQ